MDGLDHVSQLMPTEVDAVDLDRRNGSRGGQYLAPVAGGGDPGRGVHRGAEVVTPSLLGLPEVDSHPHPQGRTSGPVCGVEHRLGLAGGVDRR